MPTIIPGEPDFLEWAVKNIEGEIGIERSNLIEIAAATDDTIDGYLVDWFDLRDTWYDNHLNEWYSFLNDVVAECYPIYIERDDYDGGPGTSGTSIVVETIDRDGVREQARSLVAALLRENHDDVMAIRIQEKRTDEH